MQLKRILVPVDFSPQSLKAIDYASDLAKAFKAEIVVLHVVEPIVYATPTDLYGAAADVGMVLKEQERAAREELARLQRQLGKRRHVVRAMMQTGTPAVVIGSMAKKLKADLIVMSTHGRTGLSHLLLGSVAEKVVRTAARPVLTLPLAALKSARRRAARPPKKTRK